jgi:hypothetical protein
MSDSATQRLVRSPVRGSKLELELHRRYAGCQFDSTARTGKTIVKIVNTREEGFGCLFGLAGILAGPPILFAWNPPPPGMQCGLPIVAMGGMGVVAGGLGGAVVGMVISHLLPKRTPSQPTVDEFPHAEADSRYGNQAGNGDGR